MAGQSLFSRPWLVAALVVALLAARWIWVAGLGDYGWTYEVAARILQGEVFFRDFLLLRGPLSHYVLAGWMRLLGQHLFVYHFDLWLSYAFCLATGAVLALELGASRSTLTAGLSLAAVLACP